MLDITDRILAIRQYVDDGVAAAIEQLIREAPDTRLNRINPLAFALSHKLDERECVAAFLHATQLGLFELSWNVVCASCGGVLQACESLRAINQARYRCALCAVNCEPNLDESVEITFTVDPRVRKIEAHSPESLSLWPYVRQVFWSSGSDLPDDLSDVAREAVLDAVEVAPGERVVRQIQMSEGLAVLFDPVTHSSQSLEVTGAPLADPQEITVHIDDTRLQTAMHRLAPGVLNLVLENNTSRRVMPILWSVGEALKHMVERHIPVLTAKRLLTHQTFRDLYRTNVLDVNQRFKITNLTFLFTDLKGSTELYERIGDLAAFDLVRSHFQIAEEIVSRKGGAIVKTIGDAIMATFPNPVQGIAAALEIREAVNRLNRRNNRQELLLKIGIHSGPCLAVSMNDRQDYFGQTVNIASRVENIASPDAILVTSSSADDAEAHDFIRRQGAAPSSFLANLRGIDREIRVYSVPS